MDQRKKALTNEELRRRFTSQFDLVNYAIRLAENMVHTGRDTRIKTDVHSKAFQILQEIKEHKDRFDIEIVDDVDGITVI
jgi:DNA-directed RNA polymerase subunit omega